MEDKNKTAELKQILESIEKVIKMYNCMNTEEQLELVKKEEKKDVKNVFVGVYNDNCVGLFKKIDWSTSIEQWTEFHSAKYDAGSIYVGIDSDYIGLKTTHESYYSTDRWDDIGENVVFNGNDYTANINMKNAISFDEMRLLMFRAGLIKYYDFGRATTQEILEVLNYAFDYYHLIDDFQERR